MGTSVQMIDSTYGHLAQDAEDQDRGLLDAYDDASDAPVGTLWARRAGYAMGRAGMRHKKTPQLRGFPGHGRGGFRTCDLSRVKRALATPPRPARPVFVAI
jgi:hypothetical protein